MTIPLRVLLLEDSMSDAELVLHELQRAGYDPQYQRAYDQAGFLAALESQPEIILADFRLPQFDGLRALKLVQERQLDIPFIIISGTIGEDLAVEAMKQGAVDYLLKDRLARLSQAVAHALEQKRLRGEKIQADEALRKSEQRYRTITENMFDVIWLMDLDLRVTWISPSVTRELGYSLEELQSQPLDQRFTPDSFERVHSIMKSEITQQNLADRKNGITLSGEFELYRKDGTIYWCEVKITLLRGANGEPTGFLGVGHDISERKQAEARLAQEQSLLQALMDTIPDTIYFKDEKSRFIRVNQAQAAHFGLDDPAQVLGRTDFDFFPEEFARKSFEDEQSILRTGVPLVNSEEREANPDGLDTWFLTTKMPLLDKEGKIIGTFGISRDVSERKQAEEALLASEERFHSLFENSTIGLYRTTPSGAILLANPALIRMLGFATFDELAQRNLEQEGFAPEYGRSHFRQRIDLEGEVKGLEAAWARKDGSRIFVRESAKAIRGPDGQVLYYEGTVEDITERKNAEDALRVAEEKYRLIFENSMEGIYQSTPQGQFITANPALAHMFGYSSPEELMASASDLNHLFYVDPNRRPEFMRLLDENGAVSGFESQIYRKDGSLVWVSENAHLVRDEIGGIRYYEGTVLDITERRQAAEALQESELLLAEAQNIAQVGSWQYDVVKDKTTWSQEMFRIFDRDPALGSPSWLEHRSSIHPQDWDKVDIAVQAAVERGIPYSLEFRLAHPDQSEAWAWTIGKVVQDGSGKVIKLYGTVQDITERKRAETEIKEAHDRLEATLDAIPELMFEVDRDGRIYDYHAPVFQILYAPPEVFLGKFVEDVLPKPAAGTIQKAIAEAAAQGWHRGACYTLDLPDGQRWFELSISTRGEAGSPEAHFIVLARDITERMQAGEKIRASLAEKEVLLKEIHHRVKNNLAIVSSLLEMQARRSQDEQVRNEFQVSQQRILAMAQIHEQLYRSQNLAQIDMADYVTALTKGLLSMDILSDIAIQVEIQDVSLDIDQAVPCGLIINELLTNALKYAFAGIAGLGDPDRERRKEVKVSMQPQDGCFILSVSDNGAGLPAEVDVRSTRTLGLRLVNRLTAQLKGDLQVSSAPGGGTVISIKFPVAGEG
jgi:PAS domain S-box-containing protein